jgi:flavin-binding protein dodecin
VSVHKVIEVLAQSEKGWEDAARQAVAAAAESVDNIKSIYIQDQHGIVEGGRIAQYRVNAKITFEVKGTTQG